MAIRRPPPLPPRDSAPVPTTELSVHLKRADGLELMVQGEATVVTQTVERLLVGLGVLAAAPA